MKKNKKLFAILTLVAFMMTLMPVMAFANANDGVAVTWGTAPAYDDNGKLVLVADTDHHIYKIVANTVSGNEIVAITATAITPVPGESYAQFADTQANATAVTEATQGFIYTVPDQASVDAAVEAARVAAANTAAGTFNSTQSATNFAAAMDAYNALNAASKTTYAATPNGGRVLAADKAVKAWNEYVAAPSSATKLVSFKSAYAMLGANQGDVAAVTGVSASVVTAVTQSDVDVAEQILKDAGIISGSNNGGSATDPTQEGFSATASVVATVDAKVSVDVDKTADANLVIKNKANRTINDYTAVNTFLSTKKMYVWAESTSNANQVSDALTIQNVSGATIAPVANVPGLYEVTSVSNGVIKFETVFARPGSYKLMAATADSAATSASTSQLDQAVKFATATDKNVITVNAKAADTKNWSIAAKYYAPEDRNTAIAITDGASLWNKTRIADADKVGLIEITGDTVATTKVSLDLYGDFKKDGVLQPGNTVANYPVKLSTNSANIELSDTTITTDYNGTATFEIAGVREGDYKVYVTVGDYEATLLVKVGATSASNIEAIKFPSAPIATDTEEVDYKDIFRFLLTDANGNVVTDKNPKGAENATDSNPDSIQAKYVSIVSAPTANKVKNDDLYLEKVSGKDYYTLSVNSGKKFEAEGSYEVKIVLDNGKSTTVSFEVKKFDKAVDLTIEYPTSSVELNAATDTPDIYFTDANGVTKKANKRVTVAASGYAVANVNYGGETGVIKVKNDEKYLGSTITVSAVAEKENLVATTTLTVTDSAQTIKLDTNKGQVNASNRIGFKLVNSNGQAVALGSDTTIDDVTCVVTNVENPDAKVAFSIGGSTKSDLLTSGTGVVNLSSNKETTATVQIMIKATKKVGNDNQQDNNTGLSTTYYTGTETFTFGAEADKSVVMTIGSKEMVANNVPVTTDVAPFIQDNRTYVPFRALTEAFGATVDYNAENNTVTTKLDGKTVVLTVGSTVLTVNDKTVTMDVAPFIVDDRVVVPVRFVGEAFGFTVEATQDADTGATASVVFYQK